MNNIKQLSRVILLIFISWSPGMADDSVERPILHPKGLLWKIEKAAIEPSYLFGTMHVSDARVLNLPSEVEQAFLSSRQFVMEMVLNFKAMGYVTRASFFQDGRTLDQFMQVKDYLRLQRLMKQRLSLPADALKHMKPWAVLTMLMMPAEQQLEQNAALDMVLLQRATKMKKLVNGLETAEEQVAVFESLKIEEQIWMLNRAVEEIKTSDAQIPKMLDAYLKQDLQRLVYMQKEFMYEDSDIDDRFMKQLLEYRNIRMAKRLSEILQQGDAFIAIGALHLPDQQGVLNLLKQQGYKVTQVVMADR